MSEEWSDWFLHDGRGCPVPVGTTVLAVDDDIGREQIGVVKPCHVSIPAPGFTTPWHWKLCGACPLGHVHRYRIRRPRGMVILEGLLENLPATVEGVDA